MGPKIERLNIGDRVKRCWHTKEVYGPYKDIAGTIEALETECGPEFVSVRWDGNTTNFCAQVPKECLVKVG